MGFYVDVEGDQYDIYTDLNDLFDNAGWQHFCFDNELCISLEFATDSVDEAYLRPYIINYDAIEDWADGDTVATDGLDDDTSMWYNTYGFNYNMAGFSHIMWSSTKNTADDGSYDNNYWLEINNEDGKPGFFRFLAVNENRIDVGDSMSGFIWLYTLDIATAFDIELASGASLVASAATVLAAASLL